MTISVYSKPNCIQCDRTQKYLDDNDVNYLYFDISTDPEALEAARAYGFASAPIVVVEESGKHVDAWGGFRIDKLMETASAARTLATV